MIQDVYEPLRAYRDEFREKFAKLAREKFESLTVASGIDVDANRRQVRIVRRLQDEIGRARGLRVLYGVLAAIGFIAGIVAVFVVAKGARLTEETKAGCVAGAVLGIAFGVWAAALFRSAGRRLRKAEDREKLERGVAWEQMAALNRLYTWDLTVKLIEATVPRLAFDPFFTAKRLRDLKRLYGWSDKFNDGKSIVFSQSGVINGNPFLLGEYMEQTWEEKTYTGSLDISWREPEVDAEGRVRTVTRRQTLYASVNRPIPAYGRKKLLVYGNDAAPALTFSREPSGFDDNDMLDGIRKRWRLHGLKKLSRNLKDESKFTLMANQEFETWFNARDRNDEVEFRLLFTALAQTQMMELMKDTKVGFGDDFAFVKDRKLNFLFPRHLRDAVLDTAPERFHDWDYDRAAKTFATFNEKYFRDAYFALAPVLAIPLYQQTSTHEEIWKDVIDSEGSCFWEHEAVANYYGEGRFRHPSCITQSILKTAVADRRDGVSEVEVTALGFRGEKRIAHEEVLGGDGCLHSVPVEWIEYLPVERTSVMTLTEQESPNGEFMSKFGSSGAAIFRRGIRSYL